MPDPVDIIDQILSADIAPVPSNTSNLMPVFDFAQYVMFPFEFLTHEPTDDRSKVVTPLLDPGQTGIPNCL